MTIHSAKGLEFENVFIVGMEEELFPAQQSAYSPFRFGRREKVVLRGTDRAEKRVIMTYSTSRYKNGNVVYPQPSGLSQKSIRTTWMDFSPRPVPPWDAHYGPGIQEKVAS